MDGSNCLSDSAGGPACSCGLGGAMAGFILNGIADVAVKTGRLPRFMGVGVEVFGGSQWIVSCCRTGFGGGAFWLVWNEDVRA